MDYADILHSKQLFQFRADSRPDRVDDFLLSLCICRNGCRYLLTDIQHQLQTAEMHSVPVFGTLVEKPEEEGYKHEAHNDQ